MIRKFFAALLGLFMLNSCTSAPSGSIVIPANGILLDVRSAEEYQQDHLENAINIPHDQIMTQISKIVPEKNRPLYIYCRSGRRVKIAIKTLQALNYTVLHDLGGIEDARKSLRR